MQTFISMLRGINVSGQKKIRMAELHKMYEKLDLVNIQTYVQSGNVVFDSEEQDAVKLRKSIETQIETTFGFSVPVLIRTADDFQRILESNPFTIESNEDPARVLVAFLYNHPDQSKLKNLSVPENETSEFVIGEQEILLFCPDGYGRTKLSNNFFEKKLELIATTRNWKTVNALYQMASER